MKKKLYLTYLIIFFIISYKYSLTAYGYEKILQVNTLTKIKSNYTIFDFVLYQNIFINSNLPYEGFGNSTSIYGNHILIGSKAGTAYFFTHSDNWIESNKFAFENSNFGCSVSLSEKYAIVGAEGAAYVFELISENWTLMDIIKSFEDENQEYSLFGNSVSIKDDFLIVGDIGYANFSGAVYFFKRDGSSWRQHAKFISENFHYWDNYGASVSMSTEYAIVGSPGENGPPPPFHKKKEISGYGSAYIYKRNGENWILHTVLQESNAKAFGCHVSITTNTAIITSANNVYLFKLEGNIWVNKGQIIHTNKEYAFSSISLSENFVSIGETVYLDSGVVYIYKLNCDDTCIQIGKIMSNIASDNNEFGSSVSIFGDTLLIGDSDDEGKAYIYSLKKSKDYNNSLKEIIMILQFLASNYSNITTSDADVNCDDKIDMLDAIVLLNFLAFENIW